MLTIFKKKIYLCLLVLIISHKFIYSVRAKYYI